MVPPSNIGVAQTPSKIGLNSTNVEADFILGINSHFYNCEQAFDKKKSIFINGLSKNWYTMYIDCLAVYRFQTVGDNYFYSLRN